MSDGTIKIADPNRICECGCPREAHLNGWECKYCGGNRCSGYRCREIEVPDIFNED